MVVVLYIIIFVYHVSRAHLYPTPVNHMPRYYLPRYLPEPPPSSHTHSLHPPFFPFSKISKFPNRRRKSQIPRPRRPTIQPDALEILLSEEVPTLLRIYAPYIPHQDALPLADGGGRVGRRAVEVGVPFFGYEAGFARQGRGGVEGEHVDALDVFRVGAEVGGVVHFVFEELCVALHWLARFRSRGLRERKENARCRRLCCL